MIARASASRGRWYTDGPDFTAVPCAHCKLLVESVDRRGRCDDCARDPLLAGHDEVATIDLEVAVGLGRLSFARRELAAGERDLGRDEGFTAWLDARQAEALEQQLAELADEHRPLPHRSAQAA